MDVEITNMTINDFEEIADNLEENFDNFWSASILKQEIENSFNLPKYYFVAKLNSEIVGFCGVSQILDELDITNIVTKKDKRNSGIASSLLTKIISFANTLNIKTITLEVNENNTSALHLYEKFNFQKVGIRKNYYNGKDNAILMNLNLFN